MTVDRLDPDTLARLREAADDAAQAAYSVAVSLHPATLLALLDGYAPDAAPSVTQYTAAGVAEADPDGQSFTWIKADDVSAAFRALYAERDAALAHIAAALALVETAKQAILLNLSLHSPSPSTAGCYGGIGGQAFTAHCAEVCQHPRHGADLARLDDLTREFLRSAERLTDTDKGQAEAVEHRACDTCPTPCRDCAEGDR